MFKSLFNENQLIGPQKYTFTGSKSSQNASIFHEKNDGGVKFFIGYPYTTGYGGIQEYCCPYPVDKASEERVSYCTKEEQQVKNTVKTRVTTYKFSFSMN